MGRFAISVMAGENPDGKIHDENQLNAPHMRIIVKTQID